MDREDEQKMRLLELFMERVGQAVGCLPSFSDPHPDRGNAHIMKKLEVLQQEDSTDASASCIYDHTMLRERGVRYYENCLKDLRRGSSGIGGLMDTIISIFDREISKLRDAVLNGTYGSHSIVGDAVINLGAALSLLKDQNLQQKDLADDIRCIVCGAPDGFIHRDTCSAGHGVYHHG